MKGYSIMSLNSIQSSYLELSNTKGTAGYTNVTVSYENDVLTFTEDDGDVHTINAANLTEQDIETLSASLNADIKVNGATETAETEKASEGTLEENQEKMEQLQGQWDNLNSAAAVIKETVEKLSDEIKEALEAVVDEQEKITKEEQERIKELVSNQIEQFKKDKENGKDVKMSDLQSNIKEGMSQSGFDEEMSSLMSSLVVTNAKMVQMDSLLTELGVINNQMKTLDTEMQGLENTIKEQEAAAEAAKCCDPIGFENEDGTKFEFVIDKDGNGELSNFSEFLGSENFFDEMVALDADGSGDVSTDEMNNAGVKVLVTDANGNQSLKSLEEAFGGEDVNVNLGSYKEAADGTKASNGQTLLGNFDISVGDKSYEGYSTLDSEEYLTSNYNFTDLNPVNAGITTNAATGADAANAAEEADKSAERAQITDGIDQFIEDYSAKLEEFEAQFANIAELLGLDEELIETVQEFAKVAGTAAAKSIIADAKAEEAEENDALEAKDNEKEAEEVDAAVNAENEEADEEDKDKEKEAA